jgi:hypothetical protein
MDRSEDNRAGRDPSPYSVESSRLADRANNELRNERRLAPHSGIRFIPNSLLSVDPGLAVAALLALFAVLPLLAHAGLPNTADGPAHLMRQAELNQAWSEGILYPRWAPDLAYGYGMPLFHYAPPLLYQVSQLIHLSGLPLDASMKGTVILMMFLYSIGMYLFARDVFGPRAGLLAAAVYLYAPYRLREAYVQGNYGQFCGLAFYPLILWAVHGLITTRRRRYVPLTALSLAGLLLSHNISAMIFAPLLGAYLVFLLLGSRSARRVVPQLTLGLGLGLGLSAFFWLPAFGERNLIRLAGITSGFFDFRTNFISLSELLALPRRLDLSTINPYYPLSLGLAQISFGVLALVAAGLYYVFRHRQSAIDRSGEGPPAVASQRGGSYPGGHVLFFGVALLATTFLAVPASQAIWERVPLLELAEFPWRWLGPATLCAAVLAGGFVYLVEQGPWPRGRAWGRLALGLGLAFTLAVNLVYLFPDQFIPWGTPSPADALAYEAETGAIGTTSAGEFLPRWTDRYPSPQVLGPDYAAGRLPAKLDPANLPPGATATTLSHTARETRVSVSSPAPFMATWRALYWPGWRLSILVGDGRQERTIDFQITRPDGLIRAQLPAGEYQVSLRLFPTPIRRLASLASALCAAAFLGLLGVGVSGRRTGGAQAHTPSLPALSALAIGVALLAGLALTRPMASWFRVQSPADRVLGAQYAEPADFGAQVRLLAYDLPEASQGPDGPTIQARPGDTLPVVLYWRALEPLEMDYSLFLHLDAPDGTTYASADEVNPEDIPTSHWPPALYVRNPLSMSLPADLPAVRYTLSAGLYDPESGERLPVRSCSECPAADSLPLASVWVAPATQLSEGDIPNRLDYRLGEEIQLLGYHLTTQQPASLTLYWRAQAPPPARYTVFVHVLDASGQVVAQFDGPPVHGLYPSDAWWPGQIIADEHSLALPDGATTLLIGLYDPASMARLPVTDGKGQAVPEDAIWVQVAGGR